MSTTIQTIYGTLDEKQLKELKGALEEINNYFNEIEHRQKLIKEIRKNRKSRTHHHNHHKNNDDEDDD